MEILTGNAEIEKNIKYLLDPYLDLITYMMIIKYVSFTYVISTEFFGKTTAVIDITLYLEFISADDYYNTIGYYKNFLKNVCTNKHFKFSNVQKTAMELDVDIEGLTNNEICDTLKERVDNLN